MAILSQLIARILFKLFGYEFPIPAPATLRTDLYFGFYLTGPEQIEETRGSVNLLWAGPHWGDATAIAQIGQAELPTVLDVSNHLYQQIGDTGKYVVRPDGEYCLRRFLQRIELLGLLKYIVALYPIDEPDLTVVSEGDVLAANATARKVLAEFPALTDCKLAVLYSGGSGKRPGMSTYDWVGFDEYGKKSSIFTDGMYADFCSRLLPHQRTLIVPGGYKGQDPEPFVRWAHSDPRVVAIIPFLHTDNPAFLGIRSQPAMAAAYRAAGERIVALNKNVTPGQPNDIDSADVGVTII